MTSTTVTTPSLDAADAPAPLDPQVVREGAIDDPVALAAPDPVAAPGHAPAADRAGAASHEPRGVSLDDKFDLGKDRVFMSGTQAIVRLLLMQRERDRLAGLDTRGFVSGYRGSPLGGLDQQLFKARKSLEKAGVVFTPGLNEELAATAVWGTQQAELRGDGAHQGVFGMWYGKGPGVDRSGDVFRHANMAGSSRHGGVLALMGDDHTAESSTVAHQTEFLFVDTMIPILNPAGVQEMLDYGLHGYALSRFAGTWVAFKCVKDNVESTASVDGRLDRVRIKLPEDFPMPPGGLNIRTPDNILEQEARLHEHKRDAVLAYLRANRLNETVLSGGPNARLGIVTVGKSYLDVRQALDDLGVDEVAANRLGVRLLKIACPWPVDPSEVMAFARGLETVIVVEEKRSLIEVQVREELYGSPVQPIVVGKKDEAGAWLFPVKGALDPNDIAVAVGERLLRYAPDPVMADTVSRLRQRQERLAQSKDLGERVPTFCSGCPHNSSTVVPEGMRAYAGIGCHYMVQWMERGTDGFTAMGGEGANWVGEAPFSTRGHVFQNLGDGTYNHSGEMAIRFAVASNVNVTYKILYNDAVAMTGGQPHEGVLSVPIIARQVATFDVKAIRVVSDEPDKYDPKEVWPAGVTFHHRDDLDAVQRELAAIEGVTVLIYDQTCAAEKRRRRKRGLMPDPDRRVIINELVCEGCGDCGAKSNCVSLQPVETEFGRKRRVDQSNCNKDFSCVKGFCPSFVTVHGAKVKKVAPAAAGAAVPAPPDPRVPSLDDAPWACIVTGIGGTGVVTVGAILGMAAHLEGRGCGMIDMAGLAQKGGAVTSHVRLARSPADINAIRVSAGKASLVLGCDLLVTGTKKVMASVNDDTVVVLNLAEVMPGDFARKPDYSLPAERVKRALKSATGEDKLAMVDATRLATRLLGNSIAANLFVLGFAWQRGAVPLAEGSLKRAIELNGEAVAMNLAAFAWGRLAAHDPAAVEAAAGAGEAAPAPLAATLDEVIGRRAAFLTAYQDARYAARYRALVERAREAEALGAPGAEGFAEAVARGLFKLMAYKDEYEVARLYSDGNFRRQLAAEFEGEPGKELRLEFHLAPPFLSKPDARTGEPRKRRFGAWMLPAFGVLARFKRLRGTPFDPFGYAHERKVERQLVRDHEALVGELIERMSPATHALAVALASLPSKVRGFGPVKARHLAAVEGEKAALLERLRAGPGALPLAAE